MYTNQIITLNTLNLYNVISQLHLYKAGKQSYNNEDIVVPANEQRCRSKERNMIEVPEIDTYKYSCLISDKVPRQFLQQMVLEHDIHKQKILIQTQILNTSKINEYKMDYNPKYKT